MNCLVASVLSRKRAKAFSDDRLSSGFLLVQKKIKGIFLLRRRLRTSRTSEKPINPKPIGPIQAFILACKTLFLGKQSKSIVLGLRMSYRPHLGNADPRGLGALKNNSSST